MLPLAEAKPKRLLKLSLKSSSQRQIATAFNAIQRRWICRMWLCLQDDGGENTFLLRRTMCTKTR